MLTAIVGTIIMSGLGRFEYSELHMGVRVNLTVYAAGPETAARACRKAFDRFADLEAIMSDYRPDSELMKLCALAGQGAHPISPDLAVVLRRAQRVAERSGGAFDVTCGPYIQLWRHARKTRKLPSSSDLAAARSHVGFQLLHLTDTTATLDRPGMRLDLGGIAKGYACDEAVEALKAEGIDRGMVEAGGDVACLGTPPGKIGWHVVIAGTGFEFWLKNQAISTSGDAEQHVTIGGKRYSHICDPRTGLGLTTRRQVSVVADTGLITDSLSTALCVLDEAEGRALAQADGAQAVYVKKLQ